MWDENGPTSTRKPRILSSVGANEMIRGTRPQIGANENNMSKREAPLFFFSSLRRVRGLSKRLMHFLGSSLIDRQLAARRVNNN